MNKNFLMATTCLAMAMASNAYATKATPTNASVMAPSKTAADEALITLPMKKIGNGVAIAYRFDGAPAVGKPLIVRISITSKTDAQVTASVREGLVLSNPKQVLLSKAGLTTEHSVMVVPQAEGRFYLNLLSLANGHGAASGIAIQVGNKPAQMKTVGKVQVSPSGERVISVPAK
jgi:hypothetical protein